MRTHTLSSIGVQNKIVETFPASPLEKKNHKLSFSSSSPQWQFSIPLIAIPLPCSLPRNCHTSLCKGEDYGNAQWRRGSCWRRFSSHCHRSESTPLYTPGCSYLVGERGRVGGAELRDREKRREGRKGKEKRK